MTDRTVTVDTSDHGPVTLPEPAWCTGASHAVHEAITPGLDVRPLRSEITHQGPSINISVNTERGPRRLVELLLWQDPYPTPACTHSDDVHVAVHLLDGDHFGYDVHALEALATDLMEAAGRVRLVARRLTAETPRGRR